VPAKVAVDLALHPRSGFRLCPWPAR
jgi:hypothetical protein